MGMPIRIEKLNDLKHLAGIPTGPKEPIKEPDKEEPIKTAPESRTSDPRFDDFRRFAGLTDRYGEFRLPLKEEKDPDWKAAAEKLMQSYTKTDQKSFVIRAYLRAVIAGNQAQATHVATNMLDKQTAKKIREKLIDLAGKNESVEDLTEAKLLSRKKLFSFLQDLKDAKVKLPKDYKSFRNETYGKQSMIYLDWGSPEDRKKGEQALRAAGFTVTKYDVPTVSQVQVSYFKGYHWDEEKAAWNNATLSEGKKKRKLSVPEQHQLAIAKKTLKMPDAMVGVMGGMTKKEAEAIIKKLGEAEDVKSVEMNEAFPTDNEMMKGTKVAKDPATNAVFINIKGTVWAYNPMSKRPVNHGSYEEFMNKLKAGKYAERIKLLKKEGVSWNGHTLTTEARAKAPKKLSKKALDKEIERVYYKHGSGVQISIMDISKIFKAGHEAYAAGEDLDAAIQAAIQKYRKN